MITGRVFTSISCFHKHFFKRHSQWIYRIMSKKTKKQKKKLRDVVSLRTEFFQFDTCGCQITRVPYQKEAQICNNLFLVFFFADTMLFLVPKHFISFVTCIWWCFLFFFLAWAIAIVQSEVKFACWNKWRFFGYNSKASCVEIRVCFSWCQILLNSSIWYKCSEIPLRYRME